jgi:hypothetical protein
MMGVSPHIVMITIDTSAISTCLMQAQVHGLTLVVLNVRLVVLHGLATIDGQRC